MSYKIYHISELSFQCISLSFMFIDSSASEPAKKSANQLNRERIVKRATLELKDGNLFMTLSHIYPILVILINLF